MLQRKLASKTFDFFHDGQFCGVCGSESSWVAKFCGKCGAKLAQVKNISGGLYKVAVRKGFQPDKKLVTVVIVLAFFTSFFLAFANSSRKALARNRKFIDVPTDHQIYSECQELLAIDGCRFSENYEINPYSPVSVADVNHALIAIMRFYRIEPGSEMFLTGDKVDSDNLRASLSRLARIIGLEERLKQIPEQRFGDCTRISVFSILEKVFLRKKR
ncbi:MAG: hypothetical protein Kow0029_20080 [Candidatus Rifleibacteriota bacterium]